MAPEQAFLGMSSRGGAYSGLQDVDGKGHFENVTTREPGPHGRFQCQVAGTWSNSVREVITRSL
jgi:hypothetical protein